MPNLTVRKIPKGVYTVLRRDAKRHGRSLNAEVLAMLADRAAMARRHGNALKILERINRRREELARKYPQQIDSAELIREIRDER